MSYNTQEFIKQKKDAKDDFVEKNFLLVSLEESKAKRIAEVINNDTARKILEHLAKKDCSETDLSNELGIAISTVHYNLKLLQEANLVVVEEFHYSKKGKEINHYSLANKYIIIAPRVENTRFIEALKKILPVTIITAIVGAAMTIINFLTNTTAQASGTSAKEAAPLMAVAPIATQAAGVAASQSADIAASNASIAARPFLQSNLIAYFLIGALAIIIIYFLYELIRKK